MHCVELGGPERGLLLQIARASIVHGFSHGAPLEEVDLLEARLMDGALESPGATFVTLKEYGELRGCVGSLETKLPLAVDVARNAYGAAFMDSRFVGLQASEQEAIRIEITVLSPHEAISAASEAQLLAQLEPGTDGLVLECNGRRATFLPQVWEQLTDPQQFVDQLKLKAGLAPRHWPDAIKAYRYRAESFAEPASV